MKIEYNACVDLHAAVFWHRPKPGSRQASNHNLLESGHPTVQLWLTGSAVDRRELRKRRLDRSVAGSPKAEAVGNWSDTTPSILKPSATSSRRSSGFRAPLPGCHWSIRFRRGRVGFGLRGCCFPADLSGADRRRHALPDGFSQTAPIDFKQRRPHPTQDPAELSENLRPGRRFSPLPPRQISAAQPWTR